jgi:hypothetical protein
VSEENFLLFQKTLTLLSVIALTGASIDEHKQDVHTTHSEISKPVHVPVYQKIGVPIPHPIPVAVPQYVKIPIPQVNLK